MNSIEIGLDLKTLLTIVGVLWTIASFVIIIFQRNQALEIENQNAKTFDKLDKRFDALEKDVAVLKSQSILNTLQSRVFSLELQIKQNANHD